MNTQLQDQTEEFCHRYWSGDQTRYFNALAEEGWFGVDWPISLGGLGWDREDQLTFISVLAKHRCPLVPEAITAGAPLIIALDDDNRQNKLEYIVRYHNACNLELDTEQDALNLVGPGKFFALAGPGQATTALSRYSSPMWQIFEWMLGLAHIRSMADYWQEDLADEITEMQIELDAVIALFLKGAPITDHQIRLKGSQSRLPLFSTLFQMLGYYALLDPPADLTANEPVPFPEERQYLGQLRRLVARDEMLQQDQIYQEMTVDE